MTTVKHLEMPADYYEQTPDANVRATEAVMNTVRTADLLFDRIARVLRPLNVSAAGGLVLGLLRDHAAMSPSALGDRLIVTRATVTGLLDSLERRGFVERSANPADRRSLIVEITPAGMAVLQQVRERVHARERAWMSDFSDAELDAFIATLQRIQDRLTAATDDED
jgi:MarR family transcriptional regulator, 2-MHQ and catechol-resistance regulon repressor